MPQIRHKTTCSVCGYTWRTRHQDLSQVKCPKSWKHEEVVNSPEQEHGIFIVELPGPPALIEPLVAKPTRQREYGRAEVERFVRGLGAWSAQNFSRALSQRSDKDYASLLYQLIAVNNERYDEVGAAETDVAYRVLRSLGL